MAKFTPIIKGASSEDGPAALFSIEEDMGDVDIFVNGDLIASFCGDTGVLELWKLEDTKEIFATDEEGYIKVEPQ